MAHVAELDENNVVIRVIVVHNDYDEIAEDFARNLYGGVWKKTSYNSKIRGKYAGVGDIYSEDEDIFITPQPHPSWTRNGSYWYPPKPYPDKSKFYEWNESSLDWIEVG